MNRASDLKFQVRQGNDLCDIKSDLTLGLMCIFLLNQIGSVQHVDLGPSNQAASFPGHRHTATEVHSSQSANYAFAY